MIKLARFTNYKLLRAVEIPLRRLNVIVGANGVGKSSVLEGLHQLLQLGSQRHAGDGYVNGRAGVQFAGELAPSVLCTHTSVNLATAEIAPFLGLEVESDQGTRFRLQAFSQTSARQPTPFVLWLEGNGKQLCTDFSGPHEQQQVLFDEASSQQLGAVIRLRLDASALAEPHYSEEPRPRIEYEGTGLASVLQYLQGARDETIEKIEGDLRAVVPGARRVRSLPARIPKSEKIRISVNGKETTTEQVREVTGARFEVEWEGAGWIPSTHLSEGTLLTLGLLTMLNWNPPRLVLLDDIDKALHPVAQRAMVEFLRQVLDRHSQLQVIATAHSPFVLDALEPEEVLVAGRVAPGSSQIRPLKDHPSWAKRADYLKPGEFWSAVGEDWITEQKK